MTTQYIQNFKISAVRYDSNDKEEVRFDDYDFVSSTNRYINEKNVLEALYEELSSKRYNNIDARSAPSFYRQDRSMKVTHKEADGTIFYIFYDVTRLPESRLMD